MMIWQTKLRKENPMHADTHKPVMFEDSWFNGGSFFELLFSMQYDVVAIEIVN
jgi:hypothetical protein